MTNPISLRDALIDAGMALLAEGGASALTLRQAALRAGVSHAAPAHHFAGLPGLLTAIAARAFATFADTLDAARAAAGADPRAQLHGICQGYLTFAARHAGLFHVMFVSPDVDRSDPTLGIHAERAYQCLQQACLPFVRHHDDRLELAVWSMVHGYAALGFTGPAPARPFARQPDFAELLDELLAR